MQPRHVIIVFPLLCSATASQTIRRRSGRNRKKRNLYIISTGSVSRTKREPFTADNASPQLASSLPDSCGGALDRVNHMRARDVTDRRLRRPPCESFLGGLSPSAAGEPQDFRQLSVASASAAFFTLTFFSFLSTLASSDSQSSAFLAKVS